MQVGVVRRHDPARMWFMLLTCLLLLVPLAVLSNMTHSLLLTLEVYHMLYNVLTLVGWLLAVRMDASPGSPTHTFGWARLEVLTTVMTLLFLAAISFSVTVEAVQSLANAGHADNMHYPVYVMACAAAVLLANLVCYILIGGFTGLQNTLLAPSEAAKSLSPAASEAQLGPDSPRGPSRRTPAAPLVRHFVRDLGGALLLVVSATGAYLCRSPTVRYLDPALALLAVGLLVATSRGLFSECCLILLETMPATFDAVAFRARLLVAFPAVQDIHELHVWQLTPDCVVATAHVVLAGPQHFNDVAERVTAFFAAHAVNRVTLQPEFTGTAGRSGKSRCLLPCAGDSCAKARCCDDPVLRRVPTIRVSPPSQASLISRGSGSGKTTNAVGQPKDHGAAVNGDCVKRVPESNGHKAGMNGGDSSRNDIHGNVTKTPVPTGSVTKTPAPTENVTATSVPTGNTKEMSVPTGNAKETSVPTGNAKETSVPTVQTKETSVPTGNTKEMSVPTGNAKETSVPTGNANETSVPAGNANETSVPSESVPETRIPSETVPETRIPSLSVPETSVPYGSVSSVGEGGWHDAE